MAQNFPAIRLRATDVVAAGEGYDVGVEITIKDQVRTRARTDDGARRTARSRRSGEFPLKQSELGLKPFSVAMGALLVSMKCACRFEVRRPR